MTTEQEFKMAIDTITNCMATVRCGCKMDQETGEYLANLCKHYIQAYEERFK